MTSKKITKDDNDVMDTVAEIGKKLYKLASENPKYTIALYAGAVADAGTEEFGVYSMVHGDFTLVLESIYIDIMNGAQNGDFAILGGVLEMITACRMAMAEAGITPASPAESDVEVIDADEYYLQANAPSTTRLQ